MMTPDPMPPVGAPNGEKSLPETPSAVIVTTDFWAAAIMSVRSELWTVVGPEPVLAAWAGVVTPVGAAAEGLTSDSTAKAVPPAARTALRSDTARIVPVPVVRRVPVGRTEAVATAGAAGGSGACHRAGWGPAGGGVGTASSGEAKGS